MDRELDQMRTDEPPMLITLNRAELIEFVLACIHDSERHIDEADEVGAWLAEHELAIGSDEDLELLNPTDLGGTGCCG